MQSCPRQEVSLFLEDGTLHRGLSFGFAAEAGGELCFNTAMSGYQESYSDPSYFGQLLVSTMPHIGNYGCSGAEEEESDRPQVRGVVLCSPSETSSRATSVAVLEDYFLRHRVVGISHIDTRALVTHIRKKGSMNAVISSATSLSELKKKVAALPSMSGLCLAQAVSTKKAYVLRTEGSQSKARLAVIDLGVKRSILRHLLKHQVEAHVFPYDSSFAEMEKVFPHGYVLSNGPGDPAAMDEVVETVKDIMGSGKPLLGICLGHQLIGRACGLSTYKLKFGHRGVNHPVKDVSTGRCSITSQNHGFCLKKEDLLRSSEVALTHLHLNDETVAGLKLKGKPVFSVQYHPEASPGPHDADHLFEDFLTILRKETVSV